MKMTVALSFIATMLVSAVVMAQAPEFGRGAHGHFGPPPEAVEACEGKSEGDACVVVMHEREIEGTCEKRHDKDGIACRPEKGPPPPPHEEM